MNNKTSSKYYNSNTNNTTAKGMGIEPQAAFPGANFDSTGSCLHHPEVKLTQKTTSTIDGGKVVYKELRRRCPKCQHNSSASSININNDNSSSTSLEIKRVMSIQSTQSHGSTAQRSQSSKRDKPRRRRSSGSSNMYPSSPNPSVGTKSSVGTTSVGTKSSVGTSSHSRARSKSPSSRDGARSRSRRPRSRSRAKSPHQHDDNTSSSRISSKSRKDHDTPFDAKGRCHHHPHMQLAKKKLTGGWKVCYNIGVVCLKYMYA